MRAAPFAMRAGKPKAKPDEPWSWGAALLIAAVCGVIYATALPGDFVLDDVQVVASNPLVSGEGGIGAIFRSGYWAGRFASDLYRPVTILSLALDHALWDGHATGFRLANIALHALTALIAYALLRALLRNNFAALAAALFYACHPIHSEAVVPAVGRSECLAGALVIAALFLYVRSARKSGSAGTAFSLLMFFLATLSKESAFALPLILVALEYVFPSGKGWGRYRKVLPYFAVAALSLALRFWALGTTAFGGPVAFIDNPAARSGFGVRLMTAVEVTVRYLGLLAFPAVLSADYSYAQVRPVETPWSLNFAGAAAVLLVAAWGAFALRRRAPEVSFGGLWFALAYLPVSNILIPTGTIMAERLMHVPALGLCIVFGWAAGRAADRAGRRGRSWAAAAVAAVTLLYGARTAVRNLDFRDNGTLFAATVRAAPQSVRMRVFYGDFLSKNGRFEESQEQFDAAESLLPGYGPTELFLGGHYSRMGRYEEAAEHFRKAVAANPDLAEARQGLGNALRMAGRAEESVPELEAAARLRPGDPGVQCDLGKSLVMAGRPEDGEAAFRKALERAPAMAEAHLGLAWALESRGRYAEALEEYERVRSADPGDFDAALGRAGALKALGRGDDAVRAYREALSLRPGDLVGNQELGVLLAEMGRLAEAVEAFEAAVRFNPGSATALNNLGRALWMQGERERARAAFLEALRIDPGNAYARKSLDALAAKPIP